MDLDQLALEEEQEEACLSVSDSHIRRLGKETESTQRSHDLVTTEPLCKRRRTIEVDKQRLTGTCHNKQNRCTFITKPSWRTTNTCVVNHTTSPKSEAPCDNGCASPRNMSMIVQGENDPTISGANQQIYANEHHESQSSITGQKPQVVSVPCTTNLETISSLSDHAASNSGTMDSERLSDFYEDIITSFLASLKLIYKAR